MPRHQGRGVYRQPLYLHDVCVLRQARRRLEPDIADDVAVQLGDQVSFRGILGAEEGCVGLGNILDQRREPRFR